MPYPTINRTLSIALILAIIIAASSCSIYEDYEANRPANIAKIESTLDQAGFRKVSIETPNQQSAASELPMHRLNRYESTSGNVYWYADPDNCGCLYEGDESAYGRYAMAMQQEKDTAEYVESTDQAQLGMLSPFGFPPPLMYAGAWPVIVVPGGGGGWSGGGGGTHPGGHGHEGGGGGHGGEGGGGHGGEGGGHGGGGGHGHR